MAVDKPGAPSRADEVELAFRRSECVRLRREGKRFAEIAEILGYKNQKVASGDLGRALKKNRAQLDDEIAAYREMWMDRLEALVPGFMEEALDPDRPIFERVAAAAQLGKISELEAKWLGRDVAAPVPVADPAAQEGGGPAAVSGGSARERVLAIISGSVVPDEVKQAAAEPDEVKIRTK